MKAVEYSRHGGPDVLELVDKTDPTKRPDRCRVDVYAAALNPKDVLLRKGKMRWLPGVGLPATPGFDFAGVLLDALPGVPAGADVFGMVQRGSGGTCAERISVLGNELARAPAGLSHEQAAVLPLAGMTALQALRDELGVQPGQRVLINGASGGVGTLAVQLAKAMHARVVGVCSGRNAERVRSLGAERVVDYTTESLESLGGFDHIFDVFGSFPWRLARHALVPSGRYCCTIPRASDVARGLLRRVGLHRAALVVVRSRRADLVTLSRYVESGALVPCIDSTVSLADSAAGHERLETRRVRGKVVVRVRD